MEHSSLDIILRLIAVSVVAVALFRRLHLPPILGYLFVGILVGPNLLGWIEDSPTIHVLGEVGVAFLLFTIGLEFSVPQFMAMRRTLLGLGGTQVLVGTVSGAIIASALGIGWQGAVVIGGALAMSSTAIVVRQLTDQLELRAPHGRMALGILLFQDLAAVPFLVVIPILAAGGGGDLAGPLFWALVKGLGALAVLAAVGRWVLRPLFHEVSSAGSGELFTLTVLLVCLAAAATTNLLGLSLALGTFFAGMMLSETEYRHQVEIAIRPFRDVLLGLFFITVGMRLDLAALGPELPWVGLLVAGLVLGKGGVIAILTRLAGSGPQVAMRTGAVLAHGGEFGFAILALAFSNGLLSLDETQAILAGVVVSMAIAPILVHHNGALAARLFPEPAVQRGHSATEDIADAERQDHVIICGLGRVGRAVAEFLRDEEIPYVALDLDPARIRQAWEAGDPVYFADATHREILEAAGAGRAKALVITFEGVEAAKRVIHQALSLRGDLPVLVRARDTADLGRLYEAGATDVVPEVQEASLMLTIRLLLLLDVEPRKVVKSMKAVREERYRLLQALFGSTETGTATASERQHAVILPVGAHAVGRRLEELALEELETRLSAVHRAGRQYEPPEPDLELEPGDTVILRGTPESLRRAESLLLAGTAVRDRRAAR